MLHIKRFLKLFEATAEFVAIGSPHPKWQAKRSLQGPPYEVQASTQGMENFFTTPPGIKDRFQTIRTTAHPVRCDKLRRSQPQDGISFGTAQPELPPMRVQMRTLGRLSCSLYFATAT